jgi:thiol-disulfide isomerase/thioredoxin
MKNGIKNIFWGMAVQALTTSYLTWLGLINPTAKQQALTGLVYLLFSLGFYLLDRFLQNRQRGLGSMKQSKIFISIRRFIHRFVVSRRDYDEAISALHTAESLIIKHHNCSKPVLLGLFCPHCHHEDGTEPELDQIAQAIHRSKDLK